MHAICFWGFLFAGFFRIFQWTTSLCFRQIAITGQLQQFVWLQHSQLRHIVSNRYQDTFTCVACSGLTIISWLSRGFIHKFHSECISLSKRCKQKFVYTTNDLKKRDAAALSGSLIPECRLIWYSSTNCSLILKFQIIFWNNNKVFGRTPLPEVLQQAIKQFNSPPSIAEKWVAYWAGNALNNSFEIITRELVNVSFLCRSPLLNNTKAKTFVDSFLTMAGRVSL